MQRSRLSSDHDIQAMRGLIESLGQRSALVDFDEQILLPTVRETVRIWRYHNKVVGFAYIDDYNNLWFETEPGHDLLEQVEAEMIEWGVTFLQRRNTETGIENSLDSCCRTENTHRIHVLNQHGFIPQPVRSLHYSRLLDKPITQYLPPDGFSIRSVHGKDEVDSLAALHRAAFRTNHMTIEQRLAMMSVSQYAKEMDLVMVAPNEDLVAFCVCGFQDVDKKIGYTDPIGTHPHYQRRGLGKAIVSAGLSMLKESGAKVAELGTSSENIAMQKLAEDLGFVCVSEKLWFSKAIS